MAERCGDCIYLNLSDKREGSTILGGSYNEYYCKDCGKYKQVDDKCRNFKEDKKEDKNSYKPAGCFITTVVVEKCHFDDKTSRMLSILRSFRERISSDQEYLLKAYDIIGPKIADCLRNETTEYAFRIYGEKLMPIAYSILNNDDENAIKLYVKLVNDFAARYDINENVDEYEYEKDSLKGHGRARLYKKAVNYFE